MNRVVPIAMEACSLDMQAGHLSIRYLLSFGVSPGVEFAANPQSGVRPCRRAPLLPPESAVITSVRARGYARRPIVRHQRRMLLTANAAVSWSIPTLTQPAFLVKSYTPS